MKLIKSVFALVLAAALLLTGLCIWHKLSRRKFYAGDSAVVDQGKVQTTSPVDMNLSLSGFTLSVTEEQLGVLLQQALSEKLEVRDIATAISAHNEVSVTFKANTVQLIGLMTEAGELSGTLQLILKLLPEYTEVDVSALLTAENGALTMTPTAFGLMGLSLGASHLPQSLVDTANAQLKTVFAGSFTSVTGVTTKDGVLELTGTFGS